MASSEKIRFEQNAGQFDSNTAFVVRGARYDARIADGKIVLRTGGRSDDIISLAFLGDTNARATGVGPVSGTISYLRGSDPTAWTIGVKSYEQVIYGQAYPGIDAMLFGTPNKLEYDFLVEPGADTSAIAIRVEGADDVRLDPRGDLLIRKGDTLVTQQAPRVFELSTSGKRPVAARYRLATTTNTVGLDIERYDETRSLLVDPVISFSTYLGGSGNDVANGVGIDPAGNVIVVGETTSSDIPGANPAGRSGLSDAFVAKRDRSGAAAYTIYLGGAQDDRALRVAVDAAGAAYVTGTTASANFPTTGGALQTAYGGGIFDVFIAKIDPSGSVAFSTYLGGNDFEGGHTLETDVGIAVGADGSVYVAGATASSNFPVTAGAYQTDCIIPCWQNKPFVAKLAATGASLTYATYLGAGYATGVAVDSDGNAYVAGRAFSPFPSVAPLPPSGDNFDDAFAAKLNPSGSALLYASRFGGGGSDVAQAIAVDGLGNAYVTGMSGCRFPTTPGAFQPATLPCGGNPSFVVKIAPSGSQFVYASLLSGPANTTWTKAIAVDGAGRAHLAGLTTSPNLVMVDATQPTLAGFSDGFLVTVNPSGSAIEFSTYIGGSAGEQANGVAVGTDGTVAVVGSTTSTDFPTLHAAQPNYTPGTCFSFGFPGPCADGFIVAFGGADSTPPTITASPDRLPDHAGWYTAPVTITFTCSDASGVASCPIPITLSSDGANVAYSGTATDNAGNTATAAGVVQIDQTPPSIIATASPTANANGWNNTAVTVQFNCGDATSGVAVCSAPITLSSEGAAQSATGSATDTAGNSATAVANVAIDMTAPTITFSGNAGAYDVDEPILITCAASDALSGIATTSCPAVASGPATDYVGSTATTITTLTATAADNADNSASASTTFSVTVTADGICRLTASLTSADAVCANIRSIATAPSAQAKAGKLNAFDSFLASQSGKSIPVDLATLLSRLAHLL